MIKKFVTSLHVDKKIVPLLSKSTYQKSFASAVRELISNAYDADALAVNIRIDDDYKTIEIEDDGHGMTAEEFEKYLTIAGTKNPAAISRKYKREKIGQFGVGFLSIFPYCEKLEIVTTAEGSDDVITAIIPTVDYTKPDKKGKITHVEDIPITGNIVSDKSQRLKHYTIIKLVQPSYLVTQYFTPAKQAPPKKNKSRRNKVRDAETASSIELLPPLDKFKWELQEDLPISFDPEKHSFTVLKYEEPTGIDVFVNGNILYRNELQDVILENGVEEVAGYECTFVISTSYKSIKPYEGRGIKRRINNVGIGPRTDFELKRDRGYSRLHWIAGELHYPNAIKEELTISRDTFTSSTTVDAINEHFAEKLRKWAYYVEDVAVAEKALDQVISGVKKGNNAPKEETIKHNVSALKELGFKVVSVKDNKSGHKANKNPIHIDKKKKTVTIVETEEVTKDYMEVLGKQYEVVYSTKGFSKEIPCRFINKNKIEFNQNYGLFRSKTYGNLFRKLHVLLLLTSENQSSSRGMYKKILDSFLDEFEDFK